MHFSVYSNCIPVMGYTRSIICDLQRNRFDFIPNSLFGILTDKTISTVDGVKEKHDHKYDETIDEYFNFLLQKEYIFFTRTPGLYPPLDTQWHYPFPVSNAIIDVDTGSPAVTGSLKWLESVYCKNVQLRFYRKVTAAEITEIARYLDDERSAVSFLQILLPYAPEWEGAVSDFYRKYPRLSTFTFYNAPADRFIPPVYENKGYTIFTTRTISSCKDCGVIDPMRHAVNMQNFTEALQFNSCLNRKISIDITGSIRNCPSLKRSFGTIDTVTALTVLDDPEFTALWHIKKDDIDKCKDCEFRYICTDCRAYVEAPENIYSKPLKCGYDPYTGNMEDWKAGALKRSVQNHYELSEFSL